MTYVCPFCKASVNAWIAHHCPNDPVTDLVNDPINHPKHYTSDPSGVECITITRHRNNNIGAAFKYLWRAGLKDSDTHTQDLEKAVWYIQDEIRRLTDLSAKSPSKDNV